MSLLRDRADPGGPSAGDPDELLAHIARAADAMRSGGLVGIRDPRGGAIVVLAVETATRESFGEFGGPSSTAFLVLTHARARTLKIPLYTPDVVALPLRPSFDAERLRTIADPTADLAAPLKGPFDVARELPSPACLAAIRLAKIAGLLPAVLARPVDLAGNVAISAAVIDRYDELVVRALRLVTKARLPLETAENSEIAVFRAGAGEPEHYAILMGNPATDRPVLTRLHSECFTGDLLASLRCDCGSQLRGAIRTIASAGGGALLYLAQEGRGIGLVNKLRAYRLQDQGFDTMEANERLGFEGDERIYGIAARMLTLLGFDRVRLLTNNPDKIKALTAAGIDVVERVPHSMPANVHNREYLRAKAQKAGHLFE